MRILIALSALVAVALAKPGYLGAGVAPVIGAAPGLVAPQPPAPLVVGGLAAYGPANIVLGPEGVPLDTPAVAAARAQHLSSYLAVQSRGSSSPAAAAAAAAAAVAPAAIAAPAVAAVAPAAYGVPGLGALAAAKALYHG